MCTFKHIHDTDVLVIGGGGAGITAAIAASEDDARVTLVSKGKIGNSGNTIMIGGSFAMDGESAYHSYGIDKADKTYTKEHVFESIVKDGFYLSDQNLVEQFVEESPEIVNRVRLWGEKAGQNFVFGKPATWFMSGRAMGRALLYGLRNAGGIETIDDVMIVDLIKTGERVSGAVGLDIYTGELIHFSAKSVVLATGGFQPFSFKNTNSDMTGDGIAMAFRAGALLADMEFMLFLITAIEPHEIKGSILPIMFMLAPQLEYRAVDAFGNKIEIPESLKRLEKTSELCKLIHLYYYGKTISEGKGTKENGIYFDFSDKSDKEIATGFDQMIEFCSQFYKSGYYHGDNLETYKQIAIRQKKMQVGLSNEYSLGGVLINKNMESSIPGLYAAGECGSGTFGANRVADAVVEMLVQGNRAGHSAAEFASGRSPGQNDKRAAEIAESVEKIFKNKGGMSAAEANRRVEEISDAGLSYFRTEEGISAALQRFDALEPELDAITLRNKTKAYNFELLQALQARNRFICAKTAAVSARERKESRGLHLRSDYPDVDNDSHYVRYIAASVNGKIELSAQVPKITKIPLPCKGKKDFIRFIIDHDLGMENMHH